VKKDKSPVDPVCRNVSRVRQRSFHHGNLRHDLMEAAPSAPDIEVPSLPQLAAGLGVTAAAANHLFGSGESLLFDVAHRLTAKIHDGPNRAWRSSHGAASLDRGQVPAALAPMADLAQAVAGRVIRAMQHQSLNKETLT
jgi:hypothetical protein